MKRSTFLKLAFVTVAMFILTGTFAQTNGGAGVPGAADVIFTTTSPITIVTGTSVPLYAEPDPVYHSSWAYGTNWTLTAGFLWNWSANNANVSFDRTGVNDNYVVITADGIAGSSSIVSVTEEAPAAYGGCVGAATNLTVNIVATPDATITGAGTTDSYCSGDPLIPTVVEATIAGGWQNYRLAWNLEIATLGGAGLTKDEWFDSDKSSLGAVLAYAESFTTAAPSPYATSGAKNITSVVGGYTVINSLPTVYTYTLTNINDQALRHADYIGFGGDYAAPVAADFTYNALAGQTYTIQINPAPTTGPIYHIPATWAL